MINDFAQEFWKRRARDTVSSIRWTDERMLEVDVELVRSVTPPGAALVDLGCGTGDVFLALLDTLDRVTAVDMVPDFLDRIPDDPKITKVVSELSEFRAEGTFDVGLLFGVVTHLPLDQELAVYEVLRTLVPRGTVVVKNQCGRDADLEVDRWSDAFGTRYMGRYPQVDRQAERLRTFFDTVEVVRYPDEVNKWEDSLHAAFLCR